MTPSLTIRFDPVAADRALRADARAGLSATPKTLPPVWFYDDLGSELFDQITRLEEYYPTRAERLLLETHARELVAACGATTLIELGAGTCTKTTVLLDAMAALGQLERYVAVDVAESTIVDATTALALRYPGAAIDAVVADFTDLDGLFPDVDHRLIAFLGGTVGNFDPAGRARFFTDLDAQLTTTDALLLGTDLVKDRTRLVAAYDDAQGVTAAFNRNVLAVLNRELGASFDPSAFTHVALFDEEHQWIEMRLRAERAMDVRVEALELDLHFEAGEELRTEISAKFTADGLAAELSKLGWLVDRQLDQPGGDFLLTLAHPYC